MQGRFESYKNRGIMTQECTLKEAFIAKKLDEIQPTWRKGADVLQETKLALQKYVQEKYGDFLEDSNCITIKSIENTVMRLRIKLNIPSFRNKADSPVRGGILDSSPEFNPLDITQGGTWTQQEAKEMETDRKKHIEECLAVNNSNSVQTNEQNVNSETPEDNGSLVETCLYEPRPPLQSGEHECPICGHRFKEV